MGKPRISATMPHSSTQQNELTGHTSQSHTSSPCVCSLQSRNLASELVQKLPSAALATLMASLSLNSAAIAADMPAAIAEPVAQVQAAAPAAATLEFSTDASLVAPEVKTEYALPTGDSWRWEDPSSIMDILVLFLVSGI